jgi:hypothetical protein
MGYAKNQDLGPGLNPSKSDVAFFSQDVSQECQGAAVCDLSSLPGFAASTSNVSAFSGALQEYPQPQDCLWGYSDEDAPDPHGSASVGDVSSDHDKQDPFQDQEEGSQEHRALMTMEHDSEGLPEYQNGGAGFHDSDAVEMEDMTSSRHKGHPKLELHPYVEGEGVPA